MGDLVTCAEVEREGAGVRGGGGEQVMGVVTVATGPSSNRGFGVRRGGEGVTEEGGAEAEGDGVGEGAGSEGDSWVPLADSFVSDWLWRTPASRSMLQQVEGLRKSGLVLRVSPSVRHRERAACLTVLRPVLSARTSRFFFSSTGSTHHQHRHHHHHGQQQQPSS